MVHIEALVKDYATHFPSIHFGGKHCVFATQMEPLHSIFEKLCSFGCVNVPKFKKL